MSTVKQESVMEWNVRYVKHAILIEQNLLSTKSHSWDKIKPYIKLKKYENT